MTCSARRHRRLWLEGWGVCSKCGRPTSDWIDQRLSPLSEAALVIVSFIAGGMGAAWWMGS